MQWRVSKVFAVHCTAKLSYSLAFWIRICLHIVFSACNYFKLMIYRIYKVLRLEIRLTWSFHSPSVHNFLSHKTAVSPIGWYSCPVCLSHMTIVIHTDWDQNNEVWQTSVRDVGGKCCALTGPLLGSLCAVACCALLCSAVVRLSVLEENKIIINRYGHWNV